MYEQPLIINLAPTGMVPTKAMNRHVPITPKEIIATVRAAAATGITMVHIHARDKDGEPTTDKNVFAKIIGGIREHHENLVICATTSGRNGATIDQRLAVLDLPEDLRPDMASLTLSSINFARQASVNGPDTIRALAQRMTERGVKPELEAFDLGMVNYISYLWRKEILRPPFYVNLLFGNVASAQDDLVSIAAVVNALPRCAKSYYSLAGIGEAQIPIAPIAVAAACGVRVGLEDNLWMDGARSELADNGALVERVHMLAEATGRSIMTPKLCRTILGLRQRIKEETFPEHWRVAETSVA
jgi:3-keto-5-aminohexanoate cleavage enzyme